MTLVRNGKLKRKDFELILVVISAVSTVGTMILLIDDRNERVESETAWQVGDVNDRLFEPGRCGGAGQGYAGSLEITFENRPISSPEDNRL